MKERLIFAGLLLAGWMCWSCSTARGQTITGPTEPVKPMHVAWLSIDGLEGDATATFFPTPQLTAGPPHLQPMHAMFWAAEPGTYQVTAVAVDWKAKTLTPLSLTITVEGEHRPDPPEPRPDPNPYERPSQAYLRLVEPISALTGIEFQDGKNLAAIYHRFARDIEAEDSPQMDTKQFREELVRRGKEAGVEGKYPPLRAAVEQAWETSGLTRDVVPLNVPVAAEILRALAWAVREAVTDG